MWAKLAWLGVRFPLSIISWIVAATAGAHILGVWNRERMWDTETIFVASVAVVIGAALWPSTQGRASLRTEYAENASLPPVWFVPALSGIGVVVIGLAVLFGLVAQSSDENPTETRDDPLAGLTEDDYARALDYFQSTMLVDLGQCADILTAAEEHSCSLRQTVARIDLAVRFFRSGEIPAQTGDVLRDCFTQ